ncbi:MAG: phage tail tape measure protein, partial [Bacteroidales bacterium]
MASGMEIFKLWGTIEINKNKAVADIKAVDATAQKSSKNIQGNFGNIAKSFVKVSTIIAGAAAAIGGALVALTIKTSQYADEIDKMSIRTGVSRERLQELKYVASQTGVEFSTLNTMIPKLAKGMSDAANGAMTKAEAFRKLGVSVKDTNGNLRNSAEVFEEVISKLAGMEDPTQRTVILMQLFEEEGAKLTPMLEGGAEGIAKLSQEARNLGLVMDSEAIAANVKFKDTLDTLKKSVGALMMNLSNAVLPYIQKAVDWLLVNIPKVAIISEYVGEEIRLAFEYIPKLIGAVMQTLWDWLQKGWDWTINLVGDAWNWIKEDGWPWLVKVAETTWNWVLTGIDWFRNNLFPWIGETAHSTWDWVVNGVSWLADNLVSFFMSTWNWIVNGLDWVKDNLVSFFESTWDWALQGLDWIKDNLTSFFETTWSWVLTGLNWIKDTATNWFWATVNTTWNWITQGLDWIRNNVVPWIGSVVNTTWNWITSGLEWFRDNVLDLAWNTIETAWNWTANFVGGIGSWIKDTAWPWINGFVKTTWTWIADFFGSDLSWIVHTAAKWVNGVVSTIWDWTVNAAGTF